MFTGIIKQTAKVENIQVSKSGALLKLNKPKGLRCGIGSSIAVNGVCSTVIKHQKFLEFDYMPESLEKSNIADLKKGDTVNLETSMRLADTLDGHMVLGHVDMAAILKDITTEGNSKILTVFIPEKNNMKFIAPKGCIAIEGISLTVVDVKKDTFTVKIIPHTWRETNLSTRRIGDRVNIELDVLAKYLDRLNNKR